jgi:GlpG protein
LPGGGSSPRRAPLVFVLIGVCVVVALLTGVEMDSQSTYDQTEAALLFAPLQPGGIPPANGFQAILQGQVWRLFTPMLLHFSWTHVLFNMWVLWVFGSQIEHLRGTWRFALMVLAIAAASNVGQYLWSHSVLFGGMSGVNYGLFGYVWIKSRYDPASGMRVSTFTLIVMLTWFFLCILREIDSTASIVSYIIPDQIANAAHGIGLLMGVVVAYAPILLKQQGRP